MKKYIRLSHYFYNDSISSIETIRPVLIGIDRNMAVVYGSNLLGIKDINLYLKQY